MKSMTGVLTLVQEERFHLADARRNRRSFDLAHDASIEGAELQRLHREGVRVTVEYDEVPGVLVHVAHRVAPALHRD